MKLLSFLKIKSFKLLTMQSFWDLFFWTFKHLKARINKISHSVVLFLLKSALRWLEVFSAEVELN